MTGRFLRGVPSCWSFDRSDVPVLRLAFSSGSSLSFSGNGGLRPEIKASGGKVRKHRSELTGDENKTDVLIVIQPTPESIGGPARDIEFFRSVWGPSFNSLLLWQIWHGRQIVRPRAALDFESERHRAAPTMRCSL
jgi:hypothetical protein